MCRIFAIEMGSEVEKDWLIESDIEHPDGWGMMWYDHNANRTRHYKTRGPVRSHVDRILGLVEVSNVGLHFRLKTHGAKNDRLCHPFLVGSKRRPIYMMHNGILDYTQKELGKGHSDTSWFCEKELRPFLSRYPELLQTQLFIRMVEELVGTFNKLLFMDPTGEFVFANEHQFVDVGDGVVATSRPGWHSALAGYTGSTLCGSGRNHYTRGYYGTAIAAADKTGHAWQGDTYVNAYQGYEDDEYDDETKLLTPSELRAISAKQRRSGKGDQ